MPLQERWNDLQPREQAVIAGGGLLLLVCALYLLLVPGWTAYRQMQAERQRLIDDLTWLYEQAPVVRQLQNSCGQRATASPNSATLAESIRTTGRRLQAGNLQVTVTGDRGYKVAISDGDGNAVLRMTTELACAGFVLKSLKLSRMAEIREKVQGILELEFVG